MINKIIQKISLKRAKIIVNRIKPYIKKSNKIVDIGSGTGHVSHILNKQGNDITPVDVANFHGSRFIKPIIYDGKKMPFQDNHFDTCLLLMVLHHTPDPKIVFSEAARVAKEIVVIETSYTSVINKFFTVLFDNLVGNLRFEAFWNSYKTDKEWKDFFLKNGFKIIETKKYQDRYIFSPYLHILYFLKKK